jgi:Cft2 family RNA processing exonuclease
VQQLVDAGLTMQANVYYKLLISWTNQKVKDTYVTRNTFDFKHVTPFERSQIDAPGPCVLFATPGMLSGGLSLEVFKHWAPSDANMIILPGCKFSLAYCLFLCLSPSFSPTHVQISSKDCYHFSAEIDLMLACQSQYRQQTHSSVCKWALE